MLRVSFPGFASQELTNITTVSGQTLQLEMTLLPSDVVAEPVVITVARIRSRRHETHGHWRDVYCA